MNVKTPRALRAEYLAQLEIKAQLDQQKSRDRRVKAAEAKKQNGIVSVTVDVRQDQRDLIDEMIRPALQAMNALEPDNANTATFLKDITKVCQAYHNNTEEEIVRQALQAKRSAVNAAVALVEPVAAVVKPGGSAASARDTNA